MGYLANFFGGRRWEAVAKSLSVIGCIAINGSIIIGGIVEASSIAKNYFGWNQTVVKLAILGVLLLITIVCLEPEKLKPVGYFSGGVIMIIGRFTSLVAMMVSDNLWSLIQDSGPHPVTVDLFKLSGTGVFSGIGGFAYEAAGTIFTGSWSLSS